MVNSAVLNLTLLLLSCCTAANAQSIGPGSTGDVGATQLSFDAGCNNAMKADCLNASGSEGQVRLSWGKIDDSRLTVSNGFGEIILQEMLSADNSGSQTMVDLRNESPGFYFITLTSAHESHTEKILIQ
jgi:hypothetical protein